MNPLQGTADGATQAATAFGDKLRLLVVTDEVAPSSGQSTGICT